MTRVECVGTSALRDVAEGQRFLAEASGVLGCTVEVISGAREAELTFRGACSSLTDEAHAPDEAEDAPGNLVLAFDIGGGSTEVVLGTKRGRVGNAVSVDVGSVRLYERYGEVGVRKRARHCAYVAAGFLYSRGSRDRHRRNDDHAGQAWSTAPFDEDWRRGLYRPTPSLAWRTTSMRYPRSATERSRHP